jgi:hypothetical protein
VIVPKEALAAETRRAIDRHTKWDALHAFITLHWIEAEQRVTPGTYVAIDPNIKPTDYMPIMMKAAHERRTEDEAKDKDLPPACAYLLQIESFGVNFNPETATEEERAQFDRDRLGRTFHLRDDRIEAVCAWTADVHGRLFAASQVRDSESVSENFYSPALAGREYPGGQLIEALLVVASVSAVKSFSLPQIPGTAGIVRKILMRRGRDLLADLGGNGEG